MKTALVLFLSLAAGAFAADPKPVKDPAEITGAQPQEVKRLGSLSWDLDTHKLVWIVQKGAMVDGKFVKSTEQRYEILPDDAVMAVAEEARGFDGEEAASLHHLLDVLSLYCAQSVVWWDEGQGTPLHKRPAAKPDPKRDKPVKVGHPDPASKPKYRVPQDHAIAMAK